MLPADIELPFRIYVSLDQAKQALSESIKKFDKVTPILYGDSFPFDTYTFDSHLKEKGYAIHSIVEKESELPLEDNLRVGLAIVSVVIG